MASSCLLGFRPGRGDAHFLALANFQRRQCTEAPGGDRALVGRHVLHGDARGLEARTALSLDQPC